MLKSQSLFNSKINYEAIKAAFVKLNPRRMVRNPVMFVTMVGAIITTFEIFISHEPRLFTIQIFHLAMVYSFVCQFCRSNG